MKRAAVAITTRVRTIRRFQCFFGGLAEAAAAVLSLGCPAPSCWRMNRRVVIRVAQSEGGLTMGTKDCSGTQARAGATAPCVAATHRDQVEGYSERPAKHPMRAEVPCRTSPPSERPTGARPAGGSRPVRARFENRAPIL